MSAGRAPRREPPWLHAEREMQVQVRTNAEHAPVPAALQSLVVVGEVHSHETEAQVGPEHIPELGGVRAAAPVVPDARREIGDRKSTRLNSSHGYISYAVFCLKKKKKNSTHVLLSERCTVVLMA